MKFEKGDFWKYISLSVLGMIGSSGTIFADTYFVSSRLGTNGLASLNLVISVFGLINGIGMMMGIGGAARYAVWKAQGQDEKANESFTLAFLGAAGAGVVFFLAGLFFPEAIARKLGADSDILPMCSLYLKTILCFAPFFLFNHLFMAFIRNDGNPKLSMCAMAAGSLANIILDYLFLYPWNLGIFGAALATGLSPVIGLGISAIHLAAGKNQFHFTGSNGKLLELRKVMALGLSAFVNEFSSSVVLVVFNLLILKTAGNLGVAAYGIVANLALVISAVFTGISQGIQPLLGRAYGKEGMEQIGDLYRKGTKTAFLVGVAVIGAVNVFAPVLVSWFNGEKNEVLQIMAQKGLRLYFTGFLFVGYNFVTASLLSATEKTSFAFVISFFRGCMGIIIMAWLFSAIFGADGIWISFPFVEGTAVLFTKMAGRSHIPSEKRGGKRSRRLLPGGIPGKQLLLPKSIVQKSGSVCQKPADGYRPPDSGYTYSRDGREGIG